MTWERNSTRKFALSGRPVTCFPRRTIEPLPFGAFVFFSQEKHSRNEGVFNFRMLTQTLFFAESRLVTFKPASTSSRPFHSWILPSEASFQFGVFEHSIQVSSLEEEPSSPLACADLSSTDRRAKGANGFP